MALEDTGKMWGKKPFWGLDNNLDLSWHLDEEQKALQKKLIQLCRTTLRPNAIHSDKTYTYPRANMNALASIGLLGLIVPKELGGLGQSHVCAAMVTETIARYGCPSTSLVFTMHTGAVAAALLRYHDSPVLKDVLRRVDKDKMIGTLVYSDPATGGHYWFPLSSRSKQMDDGNLQVLKYASWATSAGYADWYIFQTVAPNFKGDFSCMSNFLCFKDEVRVFSEEWSAMGMHGNQSGSIVCEGILNKNRLVGPHGDGLHSNDEAVDPWFLLGTAATWTGLSLACIDLASKHAGQKRHADVGLRVCDYASITDYFGECVSETNSRRGFLYSVSQALDSVTNNNDWTIHKDLSLKPRFSYLHWMWQVRYECARCVYKVADDMLKVCGGTGFKTDLGLERLVRDSKAAWVMGPSNEVLRQWVGNFVFGSEPDYWAQHANLRVVRSETNKMTNEQKLKEAQRLMNEVDLAKSDYRKENDYQDSNFDNPFNTAPPTYAGALTYDGVKHEPALNPDTFVEVYSKGWKYIADKTAHFTFAFKNKSDVSGCLPGQFVQIRVQLNGSKSTRFYSPVTPARQPGTIELVTRFESLGEFSTFLKGLKEGDKIEMKGPCGGFEYKANKVEHLTLVSSGVGATPVVQILRDIMADPNDKTNVSYLNYSETAQDILFYNEIVGYEKTDGRLNTYFSIGEEDDQWTGGEGFLEGEALEKTIPKAGSKKQKIVICGGPKMAIGVLEYLRGMGYRSEDIYVFGHFGIEQVRSIYGQRTKLSTHCFC